MLNFIITGLATWRLANMLVNEDGPADIFLKLREAAKIEYNPDGTLMRYSSNTPLHCVWCTSVWTALFILVTPRFVRSILAASAVACLIDEAIPKVGRR